MPAALFRRQNTKKTERGRNWHDLKQPYCHIFLEILFTLVSYSRIRLMYAGINRMWPTLSLRSVGVKHYLCMDNWIMTINMLYIFIISLSLTTNLKQRSWFTGKGPQNDTIEMAIIYSKPKCKRRKFFANTSYEWVSNFPAISWREQVNFNEMMMRSALY